MSLRPIGHITELVRELMRWSGGRQKKGLSTEELNKAIAYLEEYAQLIEDYRVLAVRLGLMRNTRQRMGFVIREDVMVSPGEAHLYDSRGELQTVINIRS